MTTAVERIDGPTLLAALWPASHRHAASWLLLTLLGSTLLVLSAKVQVPFWPVPVTLQTLALQLLAMAFGWRLALTTVLLYLAEGAAGLPVFAGTPERGLGLAYMAGPTAGYLAGFLVAVVLMGWLAERGWDRSLWRALAAGLAGHAVIVLMGAGWLAATLGLERAIALGITPFLLGTAVKVALGGTLMVAAWRLMPRRD